MTEPIVPIEIRTLFRGRIFTVQVETLPVPGAGQRLIEVVRHPGSVVVVPIDESGDVVLVRQYRPAVGRSMWELPAGSLEPGENVERAAIRECHEEIGRIPSSLERLGAFYPTPGYCDELLHLFRATGLRKPGPGDDEARPDEDEEIEVRAFGRDELRRMITAGEITDLKTVAGLSLTA